MQKLCKILKYTFMFRAIVLNYIFLDGRIIHTDNSHRKRLITPSLLHVGAGKNGLCSIVECGACLK